MNLPPDILTLIIAMELQEYNRSKLLEAYKDINYLYELSELHMQKYNEFIFDNMHKFKYITRLIIPNTTIDNTDLHHFHNLSHIDLKGENITDNDLLHINPLILILRKANPNLSNKAIQHFNRIIHIEINTCEIKINDDGIKNLFTLKILYIPYAKFTNNGIINLKNLEKLNIGYNRIENQIIESLPKLTHLIKWSKTTLNGLHKLQELETTVISKKDIIIMDNLCVLKLREKTNVLFKYMPNLHTLRFDGNNLDKMDFQYMINIQVLNAQGIDLEDDDLKYLPNLKELFCGNSYISDMGLKHTPNIQRICIIHSISNDLTAKGINSLEHLYNLIIFMGGNNIKSEELKIKEFYIDKKSSIPDANSFVHGI